MKTPTGDPSNQFRETPRKHHRYPPVEPYLPIHRPYPDTEQLRRRGANTFFSKVDVTSIHRPRSGYRTLHLSTIGHVISISTSFTHTDKTPRNQSDGNQDFILSGTIRASRFRNPARPLGSMCMCWPEGLMVFGVTTSHAERLGSFLRRPRGFAMPAGRVRVGGPVAGRGRGAGATTAAAAAAGW